MRLRLPKRFYDDHVERDLPAGQVVRSTATYYDVEASPEDLAELLSDARYYVETGRYMERHLQGVVASARATVRAIEAALAR